MVLISIQAIIFRTKNTLCILLPVTNVTARHLTLQEVFFCLSVTHENGTYKLLCNQQVSISFAFRLLFFLK